MMYELFIAGERAELGTQAQVALTKQVSLLSDIEQRQADFTSRFTLPPTAKNVAIMERLAINGNTSERPYKYASAVITVNGVPIVPDGKIIATASRRGYECVVLSGNDSIFKLLGDKMMHELDLSMWDFFYDVTTYQLLAGALWAINVIPFAFPILDTGQGMEPSGSSAFPPAVYDIGIEPEYQMPAFLVNYLVRKILQEAGIGSAYIDTTFFQTDTVFNNIALMMMPYNTDRLGDYEVIAERSTAVALSVAGGTVNADYAWNYPVIVKDIFSNFDNFTSPDYSTFTAPLGGRYRIRTVFEIEVTDATPAHNRFWKWRTDKNSVETLNTVLNPAKPQTYTGTKIQVDHEYEMALNDGDELLFRFLTQRLSGFSASCNWNINNARIEITYLSIDRFADVYIEWSLAMPTIRQADFLKAILQMFNLIPQWTFDGKPYFAPLDAVLRGDYGRDDWTAKHSERTEQRYSVGGNYGKSSKFEYQYNGEDEDPEGYADYTIAIDNDTYEQEATIISSKVVATLDTGEEFEVERAGGIIQNVKLLKIPYYDDDLNLTNIDQFRLIYRENVTVVERDPANPANPSTFYAALARFEPIHWERLVTDYYSLWHRVVSRPTLDVIRVYLSVMDVYTLDHFKLKYFRQYQALYYLNKLNNYIAGKTCIGEFVRVDPELLDE